MFFLESFPTSLRPIPTNLKLGDPCGTCRCPPHYNLGDCEPGLECKHETEYLDAPGKCVMSGKYKQNLRTVLTYKVMKFKKYDLNNTLTDKPI